MEQFKPLNSPELAALVKKYGPFFQEIRRRIFVVLAILVLATVVGFVFYEQIIKFLIDLFSLNGVNIVFTSPFQFINLSISCGLVTGLVAALPVLAIQIIAFLRPALKKIEYKAATRFFPLSLVLFIAGFLFGFLIMKWQIEIFVGRTESFGISNMLDISRLLTTVLLTSALMGIGFQFPFLLLLLMRFEIISRKQLGRKRLWVYLGSFFFAMLLPPDSIIADIFLSLPLIILYEFTLLFSRFWLRSASQRSASTAKTTS